MNIEKKLEDIELLLNKIDFKMDEFLSQLDSIENLLDERFDEISQQNKTKSQNP